MEVRVYYEDTDCGGVVYYANYLKYFERARTHYLDTHGLSVAALIQEGTEFRVIRAELSYRSAATYGDTLEVETTVAADRRISLTFSHVIQRSHQQKIGRGRIGNPCGRRYQRQNQTPPTSHPGSPWASR